MAVPSFVAETQTPENMSQASLSVDEVAARCAEIHGNMHQGTLEERERTLQYERTEFQLRAQATEMHHERQGRAMGDSFRHLESIKAELEQKVGQDHEDLNRQMQRMHQEWELTKDRERAEWEEKKMTDQRAWEIKKQQEQEEWEMRKTEEKQKWQTEKTNELSETALQLFRTKKELKEKTEEVEKLKNELRASEDRLAQVTQKPVLQNLAECLDSISSTDQLTGILSETCINGDQVRVQEDTACKAPMQALPVIEENPEETGDEEEQVTEHQEDQSTVSEEPKPCQAVMPTVIPKQTQNEELECQEIVIPKDLYAIQTLRVTTDGLIEMMQKQQSKYKLTILPGKDITDKHAVLLPIMKSSNMNKGINKVLQTAHIKAKPMLIGMVIQIRNKWSPASPGTTHMPTSHNAHIPTVDVQVDLKGNILSKCKINLHACHSMEQILTDHSKQATAESTE